MENLKSGDLVNVLETTGRVLSGKVFAVGKNLLWIEDEEGIWPLSREDVKIVQKLVMMGV